MRQWIAINMQNVCYPDKFNQKNYLFRPQKCVNKLMFTLYNIFIYVFYVLKLQTIMHLINYCKYCIQFSQM
ncbi:hypothetical protein pb186bvf_015863 [Paramecium bursaria]